MAVPFSQGARMTEPGYEVAIGLAAIICEVVAVWYFLRSLKAFKKDLKNAYYWLVAGLFIFYIGSGIIGGLILLLPSFAAMTTAPYALGACSMYISMSKFARLLGPNPRWNSFWRLTVLSGMAVGVAVFMPHPKVTDTELQFDVTFGLLSWSIVFSGVATCIAFYIRQKIGVVYRKPMLWMGLALGTLTLATVQEIIVKSYFLHSDYATHNLGLAWYLLVGVSFLGAGLTFREVSRQSLSLPANPSYIDIVVAVAGLVSQPAHIDKALDKMRLITVRLQPGQELSPIDKATLTGLYLYLEDYLISREPVHQFTREDLRNSLPDAFAQSLQAPPANNTPPTLHDGSVGLS